MTKNSSKKQIVKGKIVINNDRGLHTRPSTELVKCASSFRAQVFLIYQKHAVNAKSLLGILMLAATKGSKIRIEAEGEDADEAVQSIIHLAENNFNVKY
jgi:phosphocarrier protein